MGRAFIIELDGGVLCLVLRAGEQLPTVAPASTLGLRLESPVSWAGQEEWVYGNWQDFGDAGYPAASSWTTGLGGVIRAYLSWFPDSGDVYFPGQACGGVQRAASAALL